MREVGGIPSWVSLWSSTELNKTVDEHILGTLIKYEKCFIYNIFPCDLSGIKILLVSSSIDVKLHLSK